MRHCINNISAAICLLVLTISVSAKDGKEKGKGGKAKTSPKFDVPIPPGHDAKGVKIPYFDETGKLQMLFVIGTATRVDNDHLKMKSLLLETYDPTGTPEMSLAFKTSVLDLNTQIVTTNEPVTIRRSDLEVTGENMELNTVARKARMSGKVRMLIYNHDEITPGESTP